MDITWECFFIQVFNLVWKLIRTNSKTKNRENNNKKRIFESYC